MEDRSIDDIRIACVKQNMRKLQSLVETFRVEHDGQAYPSDLVGLFLQASYAKEPYWQELVNPFTNQQGLGLNGAVIDLRWYLRNDPRFQGYVLYEATGFYPPFAYTIYGTDGEGKLLRDGKHALVVTGTHHEPEEKAKFDRRICQNMLALQGMVEGYKGHLQYYPESLERLYQAGQRLNFWQELVNPLTKKSGLGMEGAVLDYGHYVYQGNQAPVEYKGLVLYESFLDMQGYRIWGCDHRGQVLTHEKGLPFFLMSITDQKG